MTNANPSPTPAAQDAVAVGQVYRLKDDDPFAIPQGARVLAVKGEWVKYLLSVNGVEFSEGQYSSGRIASFLSRYELVTEARS